MLTSSWALNRNPSRDSCWVSFIFHDYQSEQRQFMCFNCFFFFFFSINSCYTLFGYLVHYLVMLRTIYSILYCIVRKIFGTSVDLTDGKYEECITNRELEFHSLNQRSFGRGYLRWDCTPQWSPINGIFTR